jgi:hypothetical protein
MHVLLSVSLIDRVNIPLPDEWRLPRATSRQRGGRVPLTSHDVLVSRRRAPLAMMRDKRWKIDTYYVGRRHILERFVASLNLFTQQNLALDVCIDGL